LGEDLRKRMSERQHRKQDRMERATLRNRYGGDTAERGFGRRPAEEDVGEAA
jgi:hypothetical protein